jgi:hypothetical protein
MIRFIPENIWRIPVIVKIGAIRDKKYKQRMQYSVDSLLANAHIQGDIDGLFVNALFHSMILSLLRRVLASTAVRRSFDL